MAIDPGPAEQTMGPFKGRRNAQGRYVALAASSGDAGGTIQGLSVELLDGTAAHGNRVRITADATYDVPERTQPHPLFWDMGGDMRVDGAAVAPAPIDGVPGDSDAWVGDVNGIIRLSDRSLRHPFIDRHYRSTGRGNIAEDPYPVPSYENGRKFFLGVRVKASCNFSRCRMWLCENVVGSFIFDPEDRSRSAGELCDVTSADGSRTVTMLLTHLDSQRNAATFDWLDTQVTGTTDFVGGHVLGLESGATMDISSDQQGLPSVVVNSSSKIARPANKSGDPRSYYTVSQNGQVFNGARSADGVQLNAEVNEPLSGQSAYVWAGPMPTDLPEEWVDLEWVIDLSSDDDKGGRFMFYINGDLKHDLSGCDTTVLRGLELPLKLENIGMESSESGSNYEIGNTQDWGEIYVDNNTSRIYLCNSSTFAGSSIKERQYLEAWSIDADGNAVIDTELYQGALSSISDSYLALVENSHVIFEGVPVA